MSAGFKEEGKAGGIARMDQSWLFRQGDLTMGPVSSQQIVDMLYAGELTPDSEVQLVGSGRFQKLVAIADFRVHVAKSEAKHRVDAQAQAHRDTQKKLQLRKMLLGAGLLLVLAIVVISLGSYLAVHPLKGESDEEVGSGEITVTISKAKRSTDDELVAYQGGNKRPPPSGGSAPVAKAGPDPAPSKTPGGGKPIMGAAEPDGLQMGDVDVAGINAVVVKHKATLISCIKNVAQPGVYLKIPIEFSIAEEGKVSKVWVDNPDLKNTGLQECLLKELQKWPFKAAHSGNSVNLSFNVGKKS